jgi:hypothetical protein
MKCVCVYTQQHRARIVAPYILVSYFLIALLLNIKTIKIMKKLKNKRKKKENLYKKCNKKQLQHKTIFLNFY